MALIFPLKILIYISKKVSILGEKVKFLGIENNDLIRNFKVYLHFKKPQLIKCRNIWNFYNTNEGNQLRALVNKPPGHNRSVSIQTPQTAF